MSKFETIKSAFSRQLGRGVHIMLEFSHSEFTQTYRLIDNTEAVTVEGDTFNPYPFKFIQNTQGETSGASLVLANIDRTIATEIKRATTQESIIAKVWVANVEKQGDELYASRVDAGTFEVAGVEITNEAISLSLNIRLSLNYNVGRIRYNATNFGNIYL